MSTTIQDAGTFNFQKCFLLLKLAEGEDFWVSVCVTLLASPKAFLLIPDRPEGIAVGVFFIVPLRSQVLSVCKT